MKNVSLPRKIPLSRGKLTLSLLRLSGDVALFLGELLQAGFDLIQQLAGFHRRVLEGLQPIGIERSHDSYASNATTGASSAFITAVSDDVTFSAASTRPVSASRTT